MKYLLSILFSLSVLGTKLFGADYVEITDLKNRSIFVRIIEINQSSIDVELKDGRSFIVELENLSPDSIEFIKEYKIPEREITDNPVDSIVTIECRTTGGKGTGFFAYDKNRIYLYTNQHVISDPSNLEILDSQGNVVKTGTLEVSKSKDVARFRVQRSNALELCDSVKPSEYVTVMGNSEGAGVITSSKSRIMGIGPDEIEVESDFVPGNSGGPVINEAEQVVGIATYKRTP